MHSLFYERPPPPPPPPNHAHKKTFLPFIQIEEGVEEKSVCCSESVHLQSLQINAGVVYGIVNYKWIKKGSINLCSGDRCIHRPALQMWPHGGRRTRPSGSKGPLRRLFDWWPLKFHQRHHRHRPHHIECDYDYHGDDNWMLTQQIVSQRIAVVVLFASFPNSVSMVQAAPFFASQTIFWYSDF